MHSAHSHSQSETPAIVPVAKVAKLLDRGKPRWRAGDVVKRLWMCVAAQQALSSRGLVYLNWVCGMGECMRKSQPCCTSPLTLLFHPRIRVLVSSSAKSGGPSEGCLFEFGKWLRACAACCSTKGHPFSHTTPRWGGREEALSIFSVLRSGQVRDCMLMW